MELFVDIGRATALALKGCCLGFLSLEPSGFFLDLARALTMFSFSFLFVSNNDSNDDGNGEMAGLSSDSSSD